MHTFGPFNMWPCGLTIVNSNQCLFVFLCELLSYYFFLNNDEIVKTIWKYIVYNLYSQIYLSQIHSVGSMNWIAHHSRRYLIVCGCENSMWVRRAPILHDKIFQFPTHARFSYLRCKNCAIFVFTLRSFALLTTTQHGIIIILMCIPPRYPILSVPLRWFHTWTVN